MADSNCPLRPGRGQFEIVRLAESILWELPGVTTEQRWHGYHELLEGFGWTVSEYEAELLGRIDEEW